MVNDMEFREFLVEAKKMTYAGNGKMIEGTRPGTKDLPYKKGQYYYLDSYFGDVDFIGEEVVWVEDKAYWAMNYYGEMLVADIPEGFSECLKGALKCVPIEAPYRGPASFIYKDYRYDCKWFGDMNSFWGEEAIFLEGVEIYRLKFHGGSIKSF